MPPARLHELPVRDAEALFHAFVAERELRLQAFLDDVAAIAAGAPGRVSDPRLDLGEDSVGRLGHWIHAYVRIGTDDLPAPIRVPRWWDASDPDELPRPLLWLLDGLAYYLGEVLLQQAALGLEWHRLRLPIRYDGDSRNRPVLRGPHGGTVSPTVVSRMTVLRATFGETSRLDDVYDDLRADAAVDARRPGAWRRALDTQIVVEDAWVDGFGRTVTLSRNLDAALGEQAEQVLTSPAAVERAEPAGGGVYHLVVREDVDRAGLEGQLAVAARAVVPEPTIADEIDWHAELEPSDRDGYAWRLLLSDELCAALDGGDLVALVERVDGVDSAWRADEDEVAIRSPLGRDEVEAAIHAALLKALRAGR